MGFESGPTEEYPLNAREGQRTPAREEVVQESHQQMRGLIRELSAMGKYERTALPDRREKIRSPEGEEYFIRLIENPKDPLVKKMHRSTKQNSSGGWRFKKCGGNTSSNWMPRSLRKANDGGQSTLT